MNTCNAVRDELAVDPASEDGAVRAHLAQCPACAAYQRRHDTLDTMLRTEIRWEAPAQLTDRLLLLAAALPLASAAPLPRPRPKGWHVTLAYVLTALLIGLSLAVAWNVFSLLAGELAVQGLLAQIQALPAQLMAELTRALPESRFVVAFFLYVHDKLLWLLLAAVLWAVLDRFSPQMSFGRQQVQS